VKKPGNSPNFALDRRRVVVAYVALLLAFGAAYSWTSWQSEREREMKYLSALAELGEKSVDTYIAQLESALTMLSGDLRAPGGAVDLERAATVLTRFKLAYRDLQVVVLTRADGQIVASSESARGAARPTLAEEPSFVLAREELMQGRNFSIGRPFLGLISNEWIIPMRFGVRDSSGKLQYVLGLGVPLSKTQSLWKDAPLPAGAALGLMRDDGYMVTRYPVPARVELASVYGKPLTGGPLPRLLAQGNAPASGIVEGQSAVARVETIVLYRRLSHYPLTFFVAYPAANLWSAWWQKVQTTFALIVMLAVGGVAVQLLLSRRQADWDIERGRRLRELEDANSELRSFSYTLAHDLRAPLRHIDGFVNLWRQHAATPVDNSTARYMEQISAAAVRMGCLVDELLAFAHIARIELRITPVALNVLVADVVAELAAGLADRKIEWVIGALPTVQGDRELLRLALFNLTENAIKYTRRCAQARIEINCIETGGSATISVRDNGIGFDMKYVHKLFAMFQRLHGERDFEGTGMGLANVARIVQRHGGRAWAQGEVGRGAVFFIALPLSGAA
jgi:signal transduction histidine kinase